MPKIIIVSGAVIVENGKVLLNISNNDVLWSFCGGKVEDRDQDLIDTARREAKEEVGIDLKILSFNPYVMHMTKSTENGNIDVLLVHYLARRIGEITPGFDIRECRWIPIVELSNEKLCENIVPALRHFGFLQ